MKLVKMLTIISIISACGILAGLITMLQGYHWGDAPFETGGLVRIGFIISMVNMLIFFIVCVWGFFLNRNIGE